ncbi:hypothetical protein EMIHUDRAFT_226308 [Emiliania huxleyi CCMP1516]|uniref:Uncharacterized protein n=2 Tax=Emiliania huxleyi TaxID=2903 RepID=A0A0D3KL98_EMIH1|nr:hypothetical protein EMIHUDRAFT_226308 [Emiliania huxleyi CCMP1516]EOD36533.1 hypothetical protein EMIHUDRAFT_226308 [Emiliania huxleyi CCMP1516]|eukprot:XP_005788962.1 hypothetical protein EMIHUDRAFT_226308 [Emiliania huxleyi CCMP1516]
MEVLSLGPEKGISGSVVTHAPSPPGRIPPHVSTEHKPLACDETSSSPSQRAANHSPQHRREASPQSTVCAAVPHPSTKLPPSLSHARKRCFQNAMEKIG